MKIERTELIAYLLIGLGAFLLILTFVMAFSLVIAKISILSAPSLSETLGETLRLIAEALIRVMYLGIMGWMGSIATIRGIQLFREFKQVPKPETN